MPRKDGSTLERYWYVYVPLHVAGSDGNRLIGKVRATRAEIVAAFGKSARIESHSLGLSGAVYCFKRP